jgi:hypothetical protein
MNPSFVSENTNSHISNSVGLVANGLTNLELNKKINNNSVSDTKPIDNDSALEKVNKLYESAMSVYVVLEAQKS